MRRRKSSSHEEGGGTPAWMLTYGDLMSLLMCFFVLLFAFSSIDVIKFREAVVSLQGALGVLTGGPKLLNPGELPKTPEPSAQEQQAGKKVMAIRTVAKKLENYIEAKGLQGKVSLTLEKRGLVIRFMDSVLFDLGRADLKVEARVILREVAGILYTVPNNIQIEGHTCDLPIRSNAAYPTNWELSTARATSVLRYLVEVVGMPPERLSAAGYGQYRPVVPNTSEENRRRNRRVDVVVLGES